LSINHRLDKTGFSRSAQNLFQNLHRPKVISKILSSTHRVDQTGFSYQRQTYPKTSIVLKVVHEILSSIHRVDKTVFSHSSQKLFQNFHRLKSLSQKPPIASIKLVSATQRKTYSETSIVVKVIINKC
jgi:hypothetical protein